jgi:hypothetical protein
VSIHFLPPTAHGLIHTLAHEVTAEACGVTTPTKLCFEGGDGISYRGEGPVGNFRKVLQDIKTVILPRHRWWKLPHNTRKHLYFTLMVTCAMIDGAHAM